VAILKKYDINGKEVGEITIDDELLKSNANNQMVKDYIVAIRKNVRQWSANTKGRKEISHSNQKPHRQKGLGRARQGSLAAAQFKGGGVVFGPKPKFNQHVRINKKERRAVNRYLLSEMINENKLFVLDTDGIKEPKTKLTYNFLCQMKLENIKVLMVTDLEKEKHNLISKGVGNIQKVGFVPANILNGYDLAAARNIVVMDYAVDGLKKMLGLK
jgi:large subunit ribosomal protein L4